MSYFLVAAIVLGVAAVAAGLAWYARRSVRLETLQQHHEVGSAVFLQLGVIYAVLIAFVFSEVWGEYNTAASAVNQECAGLHGVAVLAEGLPPEARDPIVADLQAYLRDVVDLEWPAMAGRKPSAIAQRAFVQLWTTVASGKGPGGRDDATRSQILTELAIAHRWRETRLFQMTLHVPGLLWVVLIGLGLVLVGFLLCFGIEYVVSQVVFTAVFAGAVALVLALVQCLDFPFEGALRLAPDDFRLTLLRISPDRGG